MDNKPQQLFKQQLANSKLYYNPSYSHLTPSGLNQHLSLSLHDFSYYIDATKRMLMQARIETPAHELEQLVEWNAPFELRPPSKPRLGVLCLHGSHDSAYSMRDIAKVLYQEGCLVRCLLNPGAGTIAADSSFQSKEDFTKTLKQGVESLRKEVDKIVLCGFSFGATLAIDLAMKTKEFAGLILLSPLIKPKSKLAFLVPLHCYRGYFSKRYRFDLYTPWVHPVRYLGASWRLGYQAVSFARLIHSCYKKPCLSTPIFMADTSTDETIDSAINQQFFKLQMHPDSRAIYYTNQAKQKDDKRISYRAMQHQDLSILSATHLSLLNKSTNPIYGLHNPYPLYTHYNYAPSPAEFNKPYALGDNNPERLKNYFIQRLTFNPDFDYMADCLIQFIRKL